MRPKLRIIGLALALLGPVSAQAAAPHAVRPASSGVDLSPVAVPILVDGRLVNYVFVTARLVPAQVTQVVRLKDCEPQLRDALVRAAHRTSFTRRDDYTRVDEAKVAAAMMQAANSIVGPGVVRQVQIVSQMSKRRSGLPIPPDLAANR